MENIVVQKGSIFIYRVFDVGEEIFLSAVEGILRAKSGETRLKWVEKAPGVIVRNAPVRVQLGDVLLPTSEPRLQRASLAATLWDYGALSLSYQIPLNGPIHWSDLLACSALLTSDSPLNVHIDAVSAERTRELTRMFELAIHKPHFWEVSEDYIIYFFESVQGIQRGIDLISSVNVPQLLLGEVKEIPSAGTQEGILENTFQYAENDLTVIDWNSALVLEPSGQREIPDVLEFALTQLLEGRFYDDLIDHRLNELYASVEARRSRVPWRNPFGKISRDANSRYMEFSEFMERMGNSLKVVGDFYLARIFRGAIRRFRVRDWEESITRKMNILARVSELLQGEMNVRRGHLLEMVIIFLIIIEIVLVVAQFH